MEFDLTHTWEVAGWLAATLFVFLLPLRPAWREWRRPRDSRPLALDDLNRGFLAPIPGDPVLGGTRVLRCLGMQLPPMTLATERIELQAGSRFHRLRAPTIAAVTESGTAAGEAMPVPPEPPPLTRRHQRHFGNLQLTPYTTTTADLVVAGNLTVGEGARLLGHVKVYGDARLEAGAELHGGLFAEGSIHCQGGNSLSGPIAAGHRVFLGENTAAGSTKEPCSVTGWEVLLQPGVAVYGDISAVERGEVVAVRPRRRWFRLNWLRNGLRALLVSLLALGGGAHVSAASEPPGIQAFRTGDGAYVTTLESGIVDPYFVNKSFIIMLEGNVDVRAQLKDWLGWLLPRMRDDGGFDRFCRDKEQRWSACKEADADDATAASIIELVSLAQRKRWIPASLQASTQAAVRGSEGMLARLHNPANGLYRVFEGKELYYLMDSAEIYSALIASDKKEQAESLAQAMRKAFRQGMNWQPSIPKIEKESFYPHGLARSYLWNNGLLPTAEAGADMAAWMAQYGDRWRKRADDNFAWGLVAWGLHRLAPIEAACWRHSVRPFSFDIGWTVLDAAADVALEKRGIGTQCPR